VTNASATGSLPCGTANAGALTYTTSRTRIRPASLGIDIPSAGKIESRLVAPRSSGRGRSVGRPNGAACCRGRRARSQAEGRVGMPPGSQHGRARSMGKSLQSAADRTPMPGCGGIGLQRSPQASRGSGFNATVIAARRVVRTLGFPFGGFAQARGADHGRRRSSADTCSGVTAAPARRPPSLRAAVAYAACAGSSA
jgi:hypothetical protein